MHVAEHTGLSAEHDAARRVDIAPNGAIQHHVRDFDRALYGTVLAHVERGFRVAIDGPHIPGDLPVEVQPTGELDVAADAPRLADEGVDTGMVLRVAEHHRIL